jgi:SAM-dependent methyltransferase
VVKLKPGIRTAKKRGLWYIIGTDNRVTRFEPWLGDSFSFLYDLCMSRSVFPRKLGVDVRRHYEILSQQLDGIHGKQVLELATGTGSAVHFLGSDNQYTGTDISPGLLRKAVKRLEQAGFPQPEFYVVSADNLPFEDGIFDLCLCILALNFFPDIESVFHQVGRVLVPEGVLVCCVPVPERNRLLSTIRGTLCSEEELGNLCRDRGFRFESLPCQNGALLYFRAIKQ